MKYQQIFKDDLINGQGVRVSLFVSGCDFQCSGCYNQEAQNHDSGLDFTDEVKYSIFSELKKKSYLQGLSILGGDPLTRKNYQTIVELCKECKEKYPNKDIWLWTGFTLKQLKRSYCKEILKYIDVLIDGKFEEHLKEPNLMYRGSSNQNILYKGTDF